MEAVTSFEPLALPLTAYGPSEDVQGDDCLRRTPNECSYYYVYPRSITQMSQALLGARSSVSCWGVVSTQPCREQRQMEGGVGTKRWKEGRREVNKRDEGDAGGGKKGWGKVRKMERRFTEGPGKGEKA